MKHQGRASWGSDGVFLCLAVGFSFAAGLAINAVRTHPLPLVYQSPTQRLALKFGVSDIGSDPRIIELDEAFAAHESGKAVFVDAREEAFFEAGHIPGAENLSKSASRKVFEKFRESFPKSQALIVYCAEFDCRDSEMVARILIAGGFENVAVFKGGWQEWEAAGLPGMP